MLKKELDNLWNREKDEYKKKEIGSGVSFFVEECIKSEEIFNLKAGKLNSNNKKKVYIKEDKTKDSRRVDFVLYFTEEVKIPVEVEKFENIEAGKRQLFLYQIDLEKKYGILTDGYIWRFYNNTVLVREWKLDDLLKEDNNEFLLFLESYTRQENYYFNYFNYYSNSINYLEINDTGEDSIFFKETTKLINKLNNKLELEKLFKSCDEKLNRKRGLELSYSYLIQFILYKVLVDNLYGENDFTERIEEIKEGLNNKDYKSILNQIGGMSDFISEKLYKPFYEEQKYINNKLKNILNQVRVKDLITVEPWLDIILYILKFKFDNLDNEIFGSIYENYLKELYGNDRGQYFTDPKVVNYILDEIGYTKEILNKKSDKELSIIDPSCGAGTFLYSATKRLIDSFKDIKTNKELENIINNNIFGLDIEEFPLYLAEMSIILKMLPLIITAKYNNPIEKKIKVFKTKDSIAEFLDTQENLQKELNLELSLDSFVRDEDNLKELKESIAENKDFKRKRYDYVVGNPPYIGYNACAQQKMLFTQLINGKTNLGKILSMNNIYGIDLYSAGAKPNSYLFFIALGLHLLKEGGYLSFIIPQTILSEYSYYTIRKYLAKNTILKSISIYKEKQFIDRGIVKKRDIATSSLIFVIQKKVPNLELDKVKVKLKKEEKEEEKYIKQSELFKEYLNWNYIKLDEYKYNEFKKFKLQYEKSEKINIYSDNTLSQKYFDSLFYFQVGLILFKESIKDTKESGDDYELINYKKNLYSIGKANKYYPSKGEIIKKYSSAKAFESNTNKTEFLKCKYKILFKKTNTERFYFTEKKVMINMSMDQAIFSDNREEILYLFALLNSPVNFYYFDSLFRVDFEKNGFYLTAGRIKEFCRVPRITEKNQFLKKEVIDLASDLIEIEKKVLEDFVDLENIMVQKFKKVYIQKGDLILVYYLDNLEKEMRRKIKKEIKLLEEVIFNLSLEKGSELTLDEIKKIECIDFKKRDEIKKNIDSIVCNLYEMPINFIY